MDVHDDDIYKIDVRQGENGKSAKKGMFKGSSTWVHVPVLFWLVTSQNSVQLYVWSLYVATCASLPVYTA